jgi:hypothetical protein
MLAASEAFSKTVGLVITFGGLGLLVNILIVYIAVQVRGEHQRNEEHRSARNGQWPP